MLIVRKKTIDEQKKNKNYPRPTMCLLGFFYAYKHTYI